MTREQDIQEPQKFKSRYDDEVAKILRNLPLNDIQQRRLDELRMKQQGWNAALNSPQIARVMQALADAIPTANSGLLAKFEAAMAGWKEIMLRAGHD
jgi:hypothetical protein